MSTTIEQPVTLAAPQRRPTALNMVLGVILVASGAAIAGAGVILFLKTDAIETLIACLTIFALTLFIVIRERTIGQLARDLEDAEAEIDTLTPALTAAE